MITLIVNDKVIKNVIAFRAEEGQGIVVITKTNTKYGCIRAKPGEYKVVINASINRNSLLDEFLEDNK